MATRPPSPCWGGLHPLYCEPTSTCAEAAELLLRSLPGHLYYTPPLEPRCHFIPDARTGAISPPLHVLVLFRLRSSELMLFSLRCSRTGAISPPLPAYWCYLPSATRVLVLFPLRCPRSGAVSQPYHAYCCCFPTVASVLVLFPRRCRRTLVLFPHRCKRATAVSPRL